MFKKNIAIWLLFLCFSCSSSDSGKAVSDGIVSLEQIEIDSLLLGENRSDSIFVKFHSNLFLWELSFIEENKLTGWNIVYDNSGKIESESIVKNHKNSCKIYKYYPKSNTFDIRMYYYMKSGLKKFQQIVSFDKNLNIRDERSSYVKTKLDNDKMSIEYLTSYGQVDSFYFKAKIGDGFVAYVDSLTGLTLGYIDMNVTDNEFKLEYFTAPDSNNEYRSGRVYFDEVSVYKLEDKYILEEIRKISKSNSLEDLFDLDNNLEYRLLMYKFNNFDNDVLKRNTYVLGSV